MAQIINNAGLAIIKQYEQGPGGGPALIAYQDSAGVWTIGWGHTHGVYKGMTTTLEEAEVFLNDDLVDAENTVNHVTEGVPTTPDQFSAMVCLCFNIGDYGFNSSSVLKRHSQGDFVGAANCFSLWDKAHIDGELVTVEGLLNRRKEEAKLYLG